MCTGTSLVAQGLRIHPPMQETQAWALVREDPTCRGATKPMRHNYWACALEPASHSYWSPRAESLCSTTREATTMRSPCAATKSSPCSLQLEKWRPNVAKSKKKKKKKKMCMMLPRLIGSLILHRFPTASSVPDRLRPWASLPGPHLSPEKTFPDLFLVPHPNLLPDPLSSYFVTSPFQCYVISVLIYSTFP